MKTTHILIGLAIVGAGAWYLTRGGGAAKAADAPTPSTTAPPTKIAGVTTAVQGLVGAVGGLFDAATKKPSSAATAPAVKATDRPPQLWANNQVQLA